MFIQLNSKLFTLDTLQKLTFSEVKYIGLWGTIGASFLICLIFLQFEANLAQNNFEYKFVTFYTSVFKICWPLMSSFSVGHIKQSVRSRVNVNLREQ